MRKITYEIKVIFRRLATITISVVAGLTFVLVGGAIAAPADKKDDNKKVEIKEKIENLKDKLDSKAFFNRNQIFGKNRVIILGGKRFLNDRFDLFDKDDDFFGNERD